MNSNVLKAILAMDSYNRGYDQGIIVSGAKIGNATIISDSFSLGTTLVNGQQIRKDQAAGFYGISYQLAGGEKVISYRGTDFPTGDSTLGIGSDILNGYGTGLGHESTTQSNMAIGFYKDVAGIGTDPRLANISLTGHSLGGGLAGLVGANDNYCTIKSQAA